MDVSVSELLQPFVNPTNPRRINLYSLERLFLAAFRLKKTSTDKPVEDEPARSG